MMNAVVYAIVFFIFMVSRNVPGAEPKTEIGSGELDELLALYQDYGLPLPPDEARLVRFPSGWFDASTPGKSVPLYALGFWLNPSAAKDLPEILVGPVRFHYASNDRRQAPKIAEPETVSLDHVVPEWHQGLDPLNAGLATAIQCHARGYEHLAQRLAAMSLTMKMGGGPTAVWTTGPALNPRGNKTTFEQAGGSLKLRLAGLAWNYWEGELQNEKSDRRAVADRLRHLLESQPALQDVSRVRLVKSIDDALKPSRSKPGSVEALIDDLVNVTQSGGTMAFAKPDARVIQIELLGFDAVPALIEHCDDSRLTRSVTQGFNNFPTNPRVVGEVVSDILQRLAGDDLGADWLARQVGKNVEKDAVQKWWERARKTKEVDYAVSHIIRRKDKGEWVNETWLRVIEHKFPARLSEIYDTCLASDAESAEIARATSRGAFAKEEKIRLLERGFHNKNHDHQHWALEQIQRIDPALANAEIIKRLDALPNKSPGPVWTSWEARIAHLVMESESPGVWEALLRAAKRADVSLRMELMNPMNYQYIGERQRRQRLAFLAAFLDDATVRDTNSDKTLYDGPSAGFQFERLSVRNFAAMQIGEILKMRNELPRDWTPEQWAQFRQKVKEALPHSQ